MVVGSDHRAHRGRFTAVRSNSRLSSRAAMCVRSYSTLVRFSRLDKYAVQDISGEEPDSQQCVGCVFVIYPNIRLIMKFDLIQAIYHDHPVIHTSPKRKCTSSKPLAPLRLSTFPRRHHCDCSISGHAFFPPSGGPENPRRQ